MTMPFESVSAFGFAEAALLVEGPPRALKETDAPLEQPTANITIAI
jgi:hypothetical protein